MLETFLNLLKPLNLSDSVHYVAALSLSGLLVLGLACVAYLIMRYAILAGLRRAIARVSSRQAELLNRMKVLARLSHIAPGLVIYATGPAVFARFPIASGAIETLSAIYLTVMLVLLLDALINVGLANYRTLRISRAFPINSFVQVAKLALYFFGAISVLSLILGESPTALFAGLGALTAVLMLVFKDPILGFVAGIQLSANKMVAVGDWIEMPKYGVDGDIMEIGLTTVKIRNFDKTITTIPTQSLINDSFKNWRGMQETGGRRIKRALHIDVSSVRFCSAEMLDRFARIQFITDYLKHKSEELTAYNQAGGIDTSSLVNGRHLTNIGTFRAYIEAYLRAHPMISNELTFLVRQLKPGAQGVPIEIYVFTTTTNWLDYERIQADIFDHLLAAAPEFDLRLFQDPTGADFRAVTQTPDSPA